MSPRAVCRLETLRFAEVYDYLPARSTGVPTTCSSKGSRPGSRPPGRLARDDVVTSRLEEPVGEARERILASGYGCGLVTSEGGVVLGAPAPRRA
jgi:hypothetical protein